MAETKIYKEAKVHDLTDAEKRALYERGNGLTVKEKAEIVKTFSTALLLAEIARRNDIIETTYAALTEVLGEINENSTHEDVASVLHKCQKVLGVKLS